MKREGRETASAEPFSSGSIAPPVRDPESSAATVAHPAGTASAAAPEKAISLLDVLIVLAKGKWFIVIFTVAAAYMAHNSLKSTPDSFKASTNFTVVQKAQWDLDAFIVVNSGTGSIANQAYGIKPEPILYTDIMNTIAVRRAVVRSLGWDEKQIDIGERELRGSVDIESTEEGVITITVTHTDPALAARIANAYREVMDGLSAQVNRRGLDKLERFLVNVGDRVETQLLELESQLSRENVEDGVIDVSTQARATIDLDVSLRKKLDNAQLKLDELLVGHPETSYVVKAHRKEIASIKARQNDLATGGDAGQTVGFMIPEKRRRYEQLRREVEYRRKMYNLVVGQLDIVRLRKEQPQTSIIPLDYAEVPTHPVGPNRKALTMAAGIGGLVIGSLVALGKEGMRKARSGGGGNEKVAQLRRSLFLPPWKRMAE